MKLFKHSYSYSGKQSSFSKYGEHQQHMSQPNYAWDNKPCYDGQAQDYVLGQSMGDLDANGSNHDNSINYIAQAQSALSSPSIRAQQGHHVMEGLNTQESHMGHEWASNSPKFSNPSPAKDSRLKMHKEMHMMGEMEHGWGNNPNQYPNHCFGGIEGDYTNKSTVFSSPNYLKPIKTNQPRIIERKKDNYWANSNSNFTSPTHGDRNSSPNLKGKMDRGWANSPTIFSSSTPTHQSVQAAYNNEYMTQKRDHGWAHSPNRFSGSTQTHHTSLEEMGRHGPDNSPSELSSPTQAHHSNGEIHKEQHLMGNMNRGWANSPTKYYGPNNLYNSNHIQNTQHGWGQKSSNGFGPIHANNLAHTSYHEHDQHVVDDDVHDLMDDILSKYRDHNVGSRPGRSSWAANPSSFTGRNQVGGDAKQQAFGGLAQYGGATQSRDRPSVMLNMEMNAGSSSNFGKEEYYSASSYSSKFTANSMINRGAYW